MDEVATEGSSESSVPLDQTELFAFPEFELHYDFASTGVTGILESILQDLSSHRAIHNWDLDRASDPLACLASFARRELDSSQFGSGSYMVNFSTVDEVVTLGGANQKASAHSDPVDMRRHFFPVKESILMPRPLPEGENAATPRFSHGRVVHTNELIPDRQRGLLLLLHAFCLRQQNEDAAFIRNFIHRHLSLKPSYKVPYRLQDVSPSDAPSICYKRVSLSLHLPHLLLKHREGPTQIPEIQTIDRECLGYFGPDRASFVHGHDEYLYKATSSVLLTIFLPEKQELREEAMDLLFVPEALWTVLLINAPPDSFKRIHHEPLEYWTPLAQFLRGVCGALELQKINIDLILEGLKKQLRECTDQQRVDDLENSHLFDDRSFGKSKLYHWIIKTCHEICASIDTTLRFVGKFEDVQMRALREKAHPYEKHALEHWSLQLGEEKARLDMLQAEVHALREQVRELRDALYGATAVLESRIAARQGDKIRILTYLTLAYLPISTVCSLYSIQVLPNKATFGSFCIVTVAAVLLTLLLAVSLQNMITLMLRCPKLAANLIRLVINYPLAERWRAFDHNLYIQYQEALDRYEAWLIHKNWPIWSYFPWIPLQREVVNVLRLFQRPVDTFDHKVKFSWIKLILDVLRVALFPLWLALLIGLGALLVAVIIIVGLILLGVYGLVYGPIKLKRMIWPP